MIRNQLCLNLRVLSWILPPKKDLYNSTTRNYIALCVEILVLWFINLLYQTENNPSYNSGPASNKLFCCYLNVPCSKVAILGMVIPPFNGNPYNGCINPYYWVDDHPLLYGNNGS